MVPVIPLSAAIVRVEKHGKVYDLVLGAQLIGVDLTELSLGGVDFHGANLTQAHLNRSDCTGVNFTGALLRGANLSNSEFWMTSLSGRALHIN